MSDVSSKNAEQVVDFINRFGPAMVAALKIAFPDVNERMFALESIIASVVADAWPEAADKKVVQTLGDAVEKKLGEYRRINRAGPGGWA